MTLALRQPERLLPLPENVVRFAQSRAPELFQDPGTLVVQYPLPPAIAAIPVVRRAAADQLVRPGELLLRNPIRDRLVEAARVYEDTAVEKALAFLEVCRELGAREVKYETDRESTRTGRATGQADLRAGFGPLGAEVTGSGVSAAAERIKQRITAEANYEPRRRIWPFSGNVAERAQAKAKECGIATDTVVESLMRQARGGGRLSGSLRLTLDISTEAVRVLGGALQLSAGWKILGGSVNIDVDSLRVQSQRHVLAVEIVF